MRVNDALFNTTRRYVEDSYMCDDIQNFSTATIAALFISDVGYDFAVDNHIVGGNIGWNFSQSKVSKDDSKIDIVLNYTIKNPIDIFGIACVNFTERKVTDLWAGEKMDDFEPEDSAQKKEIVYITANGEVYHKSRTCTYLTRIVKSCSLKEISGLRNASGGKYYPCSKCKKLSSTLYYTQYGSRVHSDRNCSDLCRVIIEVEKSKVKDRRECSKCGQVNIED